MAEPTIHLALTDDWELRGDGSGDLNELQLSPLRKLLGIYSQYGVKSTFNVEVMQQLTFREFQTQHPELKPLADAWDDAVREAFRTGQDIQLHVHPQWSKPAYLGGRWCLSGNWGLPGYDGPEAYAMLERSKNYLENLLRPIDPAYKCVAFRAGSSCIAPSQFALSCLAQLGIVFDMSMIGGLRVNTRNLHMDYSNCEESFLPFYPQMDDARKVSSKTEAIICVPIFHFNLSRLQAIRQVVSKGANKIGRKIASSRNANHNKDYSSNEWAEIGRTSPVKVLYDKVVKPCLTGKYMVGDLSQLNRAGLEEMLSAIRLRARQTGLRELPVILTCHSKYISDFSAIEGFVRKVSKTPGINFATLSDIAAKLEIGDFEIRKRA